MQDIGHMTIESAVRERVALNPEDNFVSSILLQIIDEERRQNKEKTDMIFGLTSVDIEV